MISVRSIRSDEIDKFCDLGGDSKRFKVTLSELWEAKECRPDACFVVEEGDRWVGRVAYWAFTSDPRGIYMMGLELPWDSDFLEVGHKLLTRSLREMQGRGAETLECRLYSGSTRHLEDRRSLFQEMHLPLIQEKWRFFWDREHGVPGRSDRIWYRPLHDVGEDFFVETIRRVMQGSLDRDDQALVRMQGPESAARHFFGVLKEIDYRPEWWRMAYDADDTTVGLVVPQRFTEKEGAINYIGVVPEQRGRGFVNDLLAECTLVLHENGVSRVIADVDDVNSPMANALVRAGYERSQTIYCYKTEIEKLNLKE